MSEPVRPEGSLQPLDYAPAPKPGVSLPTQFIFGLCWPPAVAFVSIVVVIASQSPLFAFAGLIVMGALPIYVRRKYHWRAFIPGVLVSLAVCSLVLWSVCGR